MSGLIGLIGAGGHAAEVLPVLRRTVAAWPVPARIVIVDRAAAMLGGLATVDEADFLALPGEPRWFVHGIGDGAVRRAVHERLTAAAVEPLTLAGGWATVFDDSELGAGSVLCVGAVVTARTRIGRGFLGNVHSQVAHDCVIGDFVSFGPGARCGGNVHIGDGATIGSGATIRNGAPGKPLRIGFGAIVGMGAVVLGDVPDGATVVGNPARPLVRDAA